MRANAREDPVGQSDHRMFGGHETPALGEQHDDGRLAQVGRLTRHVRTGQDDDLRGLWIEVEVVGNERTCRQPALDQRMAPARDCQPPAGVDLRTAPRVLGGADGEADQRVDHAHGLGARPKYRRHLSDLGS